MSDGVCHEFIKTGSLFRCKHCLVLQNSSTAKQFCRVRYHANLRRASVDVVSDELLSSPLSVTGCLMAADALVSSDDISTPSQSSDFDGGGGLTGGSGGGGEW